MKNKIFCEVCQVSFLHRGEITRGQVVVCAVCGAELEVTGLEPEPKAQRVRVAPEEEIRARVENFARLRDYTFNEDKEAVIEGLISKNELYGNFYCPCRFDNVQDNICPCLETRMNAVKKDGHCL